MSRTELEKIDRLWTDELAGSESFGLDKAGTHPEDGELALYVDGELSTAVRERLEGHLVSCAECRLIVMHTTQAMAEHQRGAEPTLRKPAWWLRWLPALAPAAVVAVVITSLAWRLISTPTTRARLADLGVSAVAIEDAGPEMAERVLAALAGTWPRPAGFESFLADERPTMRGASAAAAPVLLAPRWSVVDVDRPHFVWRLERPVTEVEVLLVDEDEQLVTAFLVPVGEVDAVPAAAPVTVPDTVSASGEQSVAYPEDAAALDPGRAYAWKVNVLIEGEWVASPYVPFRRATAAEQARLEDELARAGSSPLLRIVAFGSAGRYRSALDSLRALDESARRPLVDSLLALQHFPAEDLAREADRWAPVRAP